MQAENSDYRLSRITTLWSVVWRAHHGSAEAANSARQQLLERYSSAVRRYLRKLLNDPDAATEVFQEFALLLAHGDLRGADARRGRFRDFVKGTLFHLIADYRAERRKWPGPLPADGAALAEPADGEADREFTASWREELLARAWAALAESDARTGQHFFVVLRFRAEHPDMRSPGMAQELATLLDRPLTAAGVRQLIHRARERFTEFLIGEVVNELDNPTPGELGKELAALGLLDYCRPSLEAAVRQGLRV
jgi:DNA-directed RNA polymerase specialized sigma24 family protein